MTPAPRSAPAGPPVPLLPAPGLEALGGVQAAFTTRHGGLSRGPYASLNLAYAVGDEPRAVSENRRRVARSLGVRLERLVEAEQVHGNGVAVVGDDAAGSVVLGVDALATEARGVWLAVYAADCVPVLVADPVHPAVAAVHAGWRGAAAGIVPAALRRMREAFGTRPEHVRVALGPAIGGCCYEVGAPVARAMAHAPQRAGAPSPLRPSAGGEGPWHLDLWEAIRQQLDACGVPAGAVETVGGCTRCRGDLFFSYRRDRVTGRMAACIRLCGPAQGER